MLSYGASTTTHHAWSGQDHPHSFMSRFQVQMVLVYGMATVRSLRSFNPIRISTTRTSQCGLQEYIGWSHGYTRITIFGVHCKWLGNFFLLASNWDYRASGDIGVRLWEIEEYIDKDTQLPLLIPPRWIHTHLALKTVVIGASCTKVWATIDLVKVCYMVSPSTWLQVSNLLHSRCCRIVLLSAFCQYQDTTTKYTKYDLFLWSGRWMVGHGLSKWWCNPAK